MEYTLIKPNASKPSHASQIQEELHQLLRTKTTENKMIMEFIDVTITIIVMSKVLNIIEML